MNRADYRILVVDDISTNCIVASAVAEDSGAGGRDSTRRMRPIL